MSAAEVTIATLVYKDIRWVEWWAEGIRAAKTDIPYRTLVLSNDGTPEVEGSELVDVVHRNDDPSEYYINRVYRAWNECVLVAPTQLVVLINNDMRVSDYWLDELVDVKRRQPQTLPCSLLVESGRIPSGMPEYVRDFGSRDNFDVEAWNAHAASIRQGGATEPGRLYQPVLIDRQEFMDIGGYPCGNPGGISGDKILFDKYQQAGYKWLTVRGSVVYHVQEGEMRS